VAAVAVVAPVPVPVLDAHAHAPVADVKSLIVFYHIDVIQD
jgi:hypothetical protein